MKQLLSVYGECLAGIGIEAPTHAVRDDSLVVRVGDIVHCRKMAGSLNSYIKQVISYDESSKKFTVGTHYKDSSKDFTFVAEEINGVITEMYNTRGELIYERPRIEAI